MRRLHAEKEMIYLTARNVEITLYVLSGMHYKAVGEIYGISPERVRQIWRKVLIKVVFDEEGDREYRWLPVAWYRARGRMFNRLLIESFGPYYGG